MDTNYQILHQFLQSFAPEIGGRSTDVVTPELETFLQSFASGDIEESKLEDLSRELLANETALERLATLLKGG
jgi:hypothetical protein